MTKKKNTWCKYCNGTGKVFDFCFGNFVPCDTENDCELNKEYRPEINLLSING